MNIAIMQAFVNMRRVLETHKDLVAQLARMEGKVDHHDESTCTEPVHLLERHHTEAFLAYMNKFMPRWKMYRDELNRLPVKHEGWWY